MSEFERLRIARREVAQLAQHHRPSIEAFRPQGKSWFMLFPDEPIEDKVIRHKTTTASCLESLDDTPLDDADARTLIAAVAPDFARNALEQPEEAWESEQAAWVYCRVRTLPAILRFAPDVADGHAGQIGELVDYVWSKVEAQPRRQGVYERSELHEDESEEKQQPSYPPNAFHTFWALRTLHMCSERAALAHIASAHRERREIAGLWTQSMLASQIALHVARSDRSDPNQLSSVPARGVRAR